MRSVEFEHDPLWRTRLMSIQSARDGGHIFWRIVRPVAECAILFSYGYAAAALYFVR